MNWKRILISLLVTGSFIGLLCLAWYGYKQGFTEKWKRFVEAEFAKHHLDVDIDLLTMDPFQGFVAKGFTLYQDTAAREMVARVSKVQLDLDLAKFWRNQPLLERLVLESARLSIPFDREDPASARLELTDLTANILLPANRLEIVKADAVFEGVHLALTGSLFLPSSTDRAPFTLTAEKLKNLQRVAGYLKTHFSRLTGKPLRATIRVTGDLAVPSSLVLTVQVDGNNFRYGDYAIASTSLKGTLDKRGLEIRQLLLQDRVGRLDANALFPTGGKEVQLTVSSTLQAQELLQAVSAGTIPWAGRMEGAAGIDVQGTLRLGEPVLWGAFPGDLMGRVALGPFELHGVRFEDLSGDFHFAEDRAFFRNLALKHRSGTTGGKYLQTPEDGVRYEAEIGMDPTVLTAFPLPEKVKSFLDRWSFSENAVVQIDVNGSRTGQQAATWIHQGRLTLSKCAYESVPFRLIEADFEWDPFRYLFKNVRARIDSDPTYDYPGGHFEVENVKVSARDRLAVLTNLVGAFHPAQLIRCVSPSVAASLDRFRFVQPPDIKLRQGTIDPGLQLMHLPNLHLEAPGDLILSVGDQSVPMKGTELDLLIAKKSLTIVRGKTGLFDGTITGQMTIPDYTADSFAYTADLTLNKVGFAGVAERWFSDYKGEGSLSGRFQWSTKELGLAGIQGQGQLLLEGAQGGAIPVLGPLSAALEAAIGQTKLTHRNLSTIEAVFQMAGGVVKSDSVRADLGAYQLDGHGQVDLVKDSVDLEVSVSNNGLSGLVLNVLYSVFGTYRCEGALSDPNWSFVNPLRPRDDGNVTNPAVPERKIRGVDDALDFLRKLIPEVEKLKKEKGETPDAP